jgi:Domain of unknown function (DUF4326)
MSSGPRVLNIKHCPGKAVPEGAVYIGDTVSWPPYRLRKSKWANRFKINRRGDPRDGNRAEVIALYAVWLLQQPKLIAALPELRGRDLVCWCAPEACHGDVLLTLANAPEAGE